ncbi:MAG: hypothetical protein ACK5LM_03005 [Lactovum sp.]
MLESATLSTAEEKKTLVIKAELMSIESEDTKEEYEEYADKEFDLEYIYDDLDLETLIENAEADLGSGVTIQVIVTMENGIEVYNEKVTDEKLQTY